MISIGFGGDGGIRTLDRALQPYNGLANRRLQPLGHVSRAESAPRHMPDASRHCKRSTIANSGRAPRARRPGDGGLASNQIRLRGPLRVRRCNMVVETLAYDAKAC